MDKILMKLLKVEFKSDHIIKSKAVKIFSNYE